VKIWKSYLKKRKPGRLEGRRGRTELEKLRREPGLILGSGRHNSTKKLENSISTINGILWKGAWHLEGDLDFTSGDRTLLGKCPRTRKKVPTSKETNIRKSGGEDLMGKTEDLSGETLGQRDLL